MRWFMLCALALIHVVNGQQSERPNIIFILADDLGWNDVSFHGSKQIPTPNLDTLAYDGVIMSNYYVLPICTPTRGALLTGRDPIHIGLQHGVLFSAQPYGLGLNETIMPQYFKKLGYNTHMVGKWHLGFYAKEYTPTYRGFESHFGYYQGMEDYWDHTYCSTGTNKSTWGLDFHRDNEVVKDCYGKYSTNLFADETEKIIKEHDTSKPLFLYLPLQSVHSGNPITPLEAPWEYQQKMSHISHPNRRLFGAMVSAMDDAVGNVTKALAAKGMLNNTIIAFSTDNGGPANGFDYNCANNFPLRGVKEGLWEGGVRGTGFIWSPLLKKSGYHYQNIASVTDWLPTLLHGAGYDMDKLPDHVDGFDQWALINGDYQDGTRTEIFHNIDDIEGSYALRVNDIKVIFGRSGSTYSWSKWYAPVQLTENSTVTSYQTNEIEVDQSGMRYSGQSTEVAPDYLFKSDLVPVLESIGRTPKIGKPFIIECGPIPKEAYTNCNINKAPCVYNITADPCEYYNLAESHPKYLQDLMWRLKAINATAVPPLNKPNDPAGLPINHGGLWVPWVKLDKTKP